MFPQGLEVAVICASLKVDDQTVRRWRRKYDARGIDGLKSKPHPGRRKRLTPEQLQHIAALLEKTPAECGFDRYLWTTQLIADLVFRETAVLYHNDHVSKLLKQMGFTHQKPTRRAKERDEARIDAWRRDTWPDLLKKATTPKA